MTQTNVFPAAPFKFGMRQVVRDAKDKAVGTVIGRAQHLDVEPTYLVRDIESTSKTVGASRRESQLLAA